MPFQELIVSNSCPCAQFGVGPNSCGVVSIKGVGLIMRESRTSKKGNPQNVSH